VEFFSILNLHNFGLCDTYEKKMECYIWNETVGKKTANDIISVTWKFLEDREFRKKGVKHLIFWADSCPAQNKFSSFFSPINYSKKIAGVGLSSSSFQCLYNGVFMKQLN